MREAMNMPTFWAAACKMAVQMVNTAANASAFFRPIKSVTLP
jgi:hypothetical protein